MSAISPDSGSLTALVLPAPENRVPVRVESVAELRLATADFADSATVGATTDFFANGGAAALVINVQDETSAVRLLETCSEEEPVRVVVLHPELSGVSVAEVEAWCEAAGALLVLDASAGATMPLGAGRNTAVYYPPLVDNGGTARPVGPAMAGILARVAAAQGPWAVPAGRAHPVLNAEGLAKALDENQIAGLTEAGINALRVVPGDRLPIPWGGRTAGTDPEWKYVNLRRLALFLEHSIDAGLKWAVFEPNGEPLWTEVRRVVEEFLVGLWRLGAFQGSKPEEAFFVRCDSSTMTQDDLNGGRLVCEIGVAPVRPAEFVILRLSLTTAGRGDSRPPP
jgi:phage tail sheath protein FI